MSTSPSYGSPLSSPLRSPIGSPGSAGLLPLERASFAERDALGGRALDAFRAGDHDECESLLRELQRRGGDNAFVQHNILLARLRQVTPCLDPRGVLTDVIAQLESLAEEIENVAAAATFLESGVCGGLQDGEEEEYTNKGHKDEGNKKQNKEKGGGEEEEEEEEEEKEEKEEEKEEEEEEDEDKESVEETKRRQEEEEREHEGAILSSAILRYNQAVLLFLGKRFRESCQVLAPYLSCLDRLSPPSFVFSLLSLALRAAVQVPRLDIANTALGALAQPARYVGLFARDADYQFLVETAAASVHLIAGDPNYARRSLKVALQLESPGAAEKAAALVLKARMQRDREHADKAMQFLTEAHAVLPDSKAATLVCLNNSGCMYVQQGQQSLGRLSFQRALALSTDHTDRRQGSLLTQFVSLAQQSQEEILYNCGVCFLKEGQISLAFSCFEESLPTRVQCPLHWLRLAECFSRETAVTTPSFALQSARNALYLLGLHKEGRGREEETVLVAYAHVHAMFAALEMDHAVIVVHHASLLRQLSTPPPHQLLVLSSLYEAEALCGLGRAEEALPMLEALQRETKRTSKGLTQSDILVNQAIVHLLQATPNEAGAAACITRALALSPDHPTAIHTLVYLALRRGDAAAAKRILQERRLVT